MNPKDFYNCLINNGIQFFTGVPDSLLKNLCLCIDDNLSAKNHIIAANEGNAIAIASGYHLATGEIPLVYMQNSGLGNAINPLLSLCDPDVYSIPMLIMIGWRGEPGVRDEPQHVKQGKIQLKLLDSMDIPYEVISKEDTQFEMKILSAVKTATNESRPTVLLIKKGTFKKYHTKNRNISSYTNEREKVLEIILDNLDNRSIVVSTTGKTSREIFEIREMRGQSHQQDFLTVGSMGHCSSIALGLAIAETNKRIVCIDGDGALIMHMGNLSTVGKVAPDNFYHILMNNKVHESVGGQETSAKNVDFSVLAKDSGYKNTKSASNDKNIDEIIKEFFSNTGPSFIEFNIKPGSRTGLGRPTINPIDNKIALMKYISKD